MSPGSGRLRQFPLGRVVEEAALTGAIEMDAEGNLVTALQGKKALVLLDNAEHLLPEVADVIAWLAATDDPTVLVTSRERLRLQGEQVWPVPELAAADAVELFLAQARRVHPGFRPSAAVGELCARLDHLPLAIELAVARTALFSPEQMLERIGQRLDLLKGARDSDPRQITLRATIEWSYELLNEDEQALFRALSVFAGGCTFEAAEQVCGATPDTQQSLLDKNLLRHRDAASGRRYFMLETIREFAAEQLDELGLAPEMRLRHARFFDALGERLLTQVLDYTPLEIEVDNLRVALDEAGRLGQPLLRLGLATALGATAEVSGQTGQLRVELEAALAAADDPPSALRGRAQLRLGVLAYMQADLSSSRRSLQEALDSYRKPRTSPARAAP